MRLVPVLLALAGTAALAATAQFAISAKSGLINYIEGDVQVNGKAVVLQTSKYEQIPEAGEVTTTDGRVEILLNPGTFLRLGENSKAVMEMTRLSDTRVQFHSGSAVIEIDEEMKERGNQLTLSFGATKITFEKAGIYRFDSDPAQLRVYAGEAVVSTGSNVIPVKSGRQIGLNGAVIAEKFDKETGDSLLRWARRRAENVAMANASAARYVQKQGMNLTSSRWIYNPYFGYFTYLPFAGRYASPWGYSQYGYGNYYYYSPSQVGRVYERPVYSVNAYGMNGNTGWNNAGGYATMPQTSSGYSGAVAMGTGGGGSHVSGAATTGGAAAAAPISRESGSAGGRSR